MLSHPKLGLELRLTWCSATTSFVKSLVPMLTAPLIGCTIMHLRPLDQSQPQLESLWLSHHRQQHVRLHAPAACLLQAHATHSPVMDLALGCHKLCRADIEVITSALLQAQRDSVGMGSRITVLRAGSGVLGGEGVGGLVTVLLKECTQLQVSACVPACLPACLPLCMCVFVRVHAAVVCL